MNPDWVERTKWDIYDNDGNDDDGRFWPVVRGKRNLPHKRVRSVESNGEKISLDIFLQMQNQTGRL